MAKGRNPGIKVPGLHEAHPSVRKAFQQIITKLGQKSSPLFANVTVGGDLTVDDDLIVTGDTIVGGALTLSTLTAERLVSTSASKALESTDAVSWIGGTSNQISVADDGDGTVTLSTPQDINIGADVEFNSITLAGSTTIPTVRVGNTLAIQSHSTNNCWYGDNIYYDGAFKYIANGTGGVVYFEPSGGCSSI